MSQLPSDLPPEVLAFLQKLLAFRVNPRTGAVALRLPVPPRRPPRVATFAEQDDQLLADMERFRKQDAAKKAAQARRELDRAPDKFAEALKDIESKPLDSELSGFPLELVFHWLEARNAEAAAAAERKREEDRARRAVEAKQDAERQIETTNATAKKSCETIQANAEKRCEEIEAMREKTVKDIQNNLELAQLSGDAIGPLAGALARPLLTAGAIMLLSKLSGGRRGRRS